MSTGARSNLCQHNNNGHFAEWADFAAIEAATPAGAAARAVPVMDEDDADLQAALLKSYGEVEPKPASIDEEAQLQQAIAASRRDDAPDPGMDEEAEELQRAIAASLMADAARAPAEPVSPK